MTYTITLRDAYVAALDQIVAGSKGLDASAVLVSIVEGYLSPRVEAQVKADAEAKLVAFEAASPTATKADILAAAETVKQ